MHRPRPDSQDPAWGGCGPTGFDARCGERGGLGRRAPHPPAAFAAALDGPCFTAGIILRPARVGSPTKCTESRPDEVPS